MLSLLRIAPLLIGLLAPTPASADRAASLHRAEALLREGRPRAAHTMLTEAIQAAPGEGAAHLLQARAYLALGDGIAAEAEIARARQEGIPAARSRHLMAHALVLQDAPQRALVEADMSHIPAAFAVPAARMRGRARMLLGDDDAAAAEFGLALRLAPRDPDVWTDVGRFRLATGEIAGAIAAGNRAVSLGPRNVDALLLKGELVRGQYGLRAALLWFDRALAIDGANIPALLQKAATLGDIGQTRAMLAATRAVRALDSDNPLALFLQATLAARAGHYDLARTLIQRTGDALDDLPAAMLLAGVIELATGNSEQAIERLGRLVAAQPDNLKARRLLAAAQWRAGDVDATIATLAPIADLPQADSYVLTLIGRALERRDERTAAARYLDRAAMPTRAAGPGPAAVDPAALALLRGAAAGDALGALGRWHEAAEAYREAANISFSEPVALRLVQALQRAGNGPAAAHVLATFLHQNPRNVAAQLMAADFHMGAGEWLSAIAIYEDLRRRLGDRDAALLNNLAWAYHRAGRSGRAVALAARAHALSPANPALADTYGWLLFETGRNRRRGLALLEQAAGQAPDAAGVRWHLALAYRAAGRNPEARSAAQAALALPGFTERTKAEALLARL